VANNAPHPARLDGKEMEYRRKKDRNCMSSKMRMAVAMIDFVVSDAAAAAGSWVEDNDVDEVAATDRAGYFPR
jgi:hypothetical protein